jgi:hypothetical protein
LTDPSFASQSIRTQKKHLQICRDLSFRRTLGEHDLEELRAMSLGRGAEPGNPPAE